MRFGITPKLFGAILLTNVVMAVAFGVAMQVSLDRGFRDYVHSREERRLQALAQTLATAYAEQGNWDFLLRDASRWPSLTWRERPERRPPPDGAAPPRPPPRQKDAITPGIDAGRPPDTTAPESGSMLRPRPAPASRDGWAPPPPFRGPPGLALVDAQRRPVAGSVRASGEAILSQPVVVGGATVGWLQLHEPPFASGDSRFLDELLRTGWVVAGIALLLAALAALPLARGLLSPIRRLGQATHRLAAGDYAVSIAPGSRDELGQLVTDFNRLAATLKDAEATRRAFLADVSHELRTPLAVLRGELEALQEGIRSCTPEAVQSLQAEVATLGSLVDDLYDLAVADLGPGAYQKETVDASRLVADAVEAFADRFAARGHSVDASAIGTAPAPVHGDPRRLMQVMNNLLENALRYTDPGGRVRVALHVDADVVAIDVMDSAPGVPPHLLPRLFERLFRVEPSRSREFGGAGLGLALCRAVVQAHGGEIDANPSPLGGVWIRVRLPRAQDAAEAEA